MSIVSNLYPPIVPDTLAAFVRTQTCRIYFSLSIYNNAADIQNVQISLVNQKTNASALNVQKYPSGIKIAQLAYDENAIGDYKYYVEIKPQNGDLNGDSFEINQFYIAQLRFTSIRAAAPPSSGTGLDTWLYNNRDYFSEWSTMCLIKGIDQPHISIEGFNENEQIITFQTPLTTVIGRMYYINNSQETEYLKSYNIQIYKTSTSINNLLVNSGQIYTNQYHPNEINYEINRDLKDNLNYILVFNYTTNNLYTSSISFNFNFEIQKNYSLDAITSFEADEENGRIKISVDFNNNLVYTDKDLLIKRTSSKSNFYQWETLKIIPHSLTPESGFIWYDTSIESGVWYKYRIQQAGNFGKIIDSDQPLICVFEDMYLTNGTRQLKIKFNPNVSNFKYNVTESQQITLGSQFPYIRRNGNSFFRTFSIGGLITSLVDTAEWYDPNYYDNNFHSSNFSEPFTSKTKVYGDAKSLYSKYNRDNNINQYEDYIYEKEFRQQVQNFLYKYDTKLFRSMTQGNILVKLMDITFQPVNELGRRLYSFAATAVEIDNATIENYKKYNIINNTYHLSNKGKFTTTFESFESIFNEIYNRISPSVSRDLIKFLKIDIAPQTQNAVFYIQKTNQSQPIRSIISQGTLIQLQKVYERYIEDCYFNGKHNLIDVESTDDYYADFPESPRENTIYNITHGDNIIDNYIDYDSYDRILTITDQGVILELNKNYSLLTKEDYSTYIYVNGHWYLFDMENNDTSFSVPATITYYYEIAKED